LSLLLPFTIPRAIKQDPIGIYTLFFPMIADRKKRIAAAKLSIAIILLLFFIKFLNFLTG